MKRVVWITDIHLNFLGPVEVDRFFRALSGTSADAVLISGDIGEAPSVTSLLHQLDTLIDRPVYFVLGNHDFYRGSIAGVRAKVEALCAACPNLHWMPRAGVVQLTEKTALVGHDGWGDGRFGNYWSFQVILNDWELIDEFRLLNEKDLLAKLNALGDEAAAHLRSALPDALQRFSHVIVPTYRPFESPAGTRAASPMTAGCHTSPARRWVTPWPRR
jgi:3',5'-cyclic-AMP phosphodiesterase